MYADAIRISIKKSHDLIPGFIKLFIGEDFYTIRIIPEYLPLKPPYKPNKSSPDNRSSKIPSPADGSPAAYPVFSPVTPAHDSFLGSPRVNLVPAESLDMVHRDPLENAFFLESVTRDSPTVAHMEPHLSWKLAINPISLSLFFNFVLPPLPLPFFTLTLPPTKSPTLLLTLPISPPEPSHPPPPTLPPLSPTSLCPHLPNHSPVEQIFIDNPDNFYVELFIEPQATVDEPEVIPSDEETEIWLQDNILDICNIYDISFDGILEDPKEHMMNAYYSSATKPSLKRELKALGLPDQHIYSSSTKISSSRSVTRSQKK